MTEYKYTAKEEKFCLEVATGVDEFGHIAWDSKTAFGRFILKVTGHLRDE